MANMKTWIVLLRGINVGGNNIVRMKDLCAHLTDAGYSNVRSYIQSGNIAFESDETKSSQICRSVQNCITDNFGFSPQIMALSAHKMRKIIKDNPYPEAVDEPKNLHVCFLAKPAKTADIATLDAVKTAQEHYKLTNSAVYMHLPEGIWSSKLATKLEKCVGVPMTVRNWRSTVKTLELAEK
jgi:uncharacterized protein (DUF1697 family)